MEPTTAIATGRDTNDLPSIEAIDEVFGYVLGLTEAGDVPFCCFSEAHPYHIPAVRPKAKPKKQHNIKRRNKRK